MLLASLRVRHFQCIEEADVTLGPGLNVLYGPNDLGKSSLAAAVRAALLLQHSTTAAERFVPWHRDVAPEVEVVFCGDYCRYYRVRKTFGSSSRGSSTLEVSNDGRSFRNEGKAREVDGKLRELLGWGIAAPGGRRGASIPDSFLTQVLLAEQSDVPDILARGLTEDPDESGRDRLNQALAALAEDPTFKRVLSVAQGKVNEAYTTNGRRRGGKGSPFARHTAYIRELETELSQLRAANASSQDVRRALSALIAERDELGELRDARREELAAAEARLTQACLRTQAAEGVEAAQAALAEIMLKRKQLEGLQAQGSDLAAAAGRARSALDRSRSSVRVCEQRLEAAREQLRQARSEDREQRRALEIQKLETEKGKLESALKESANLESRALSAKQRRDNAATVEHRLREQRRRLEQVRATQVTAETAVARAREQTSLMGALQAFARVREARIALRSAEDALAEAVDLERVASARATEAERAQRQRGAINVPDTEVVRELRQLHHQMDLVDARLGGGLSVAVTLREALQVTAAQDGQAETPVALSGGALRIDAKRALELRLGDLAHIRITTGEASARAEAEALRVRWAAEAIPALQAAAVETISALEGLRQQADRYEQEYEQRLAEAQHLGERASAQRLQARDLDQRREALRECEARAPGHPTRELQQQLESMGERWQARLIEIEDQVTRGRNTAEAASKSAGEALAASVAMLEASEREEQAARQLAVEALKEIDGFEPDELLARVTVERTVTEAALAEARRRLGELATSGDTQIVQAEQDLKTVELEHARALTALQEAERTESEAREGLVAHAARVEERRIEFAKLDLAGAESSVRERQTALNALPAPEPPTTQHDVELARVAFQRAAADCSLKTSDVTKMEGRLEEIGGDALSDRLKDTEEALRRAKDQEAELDLDYNAWRLLADTLRETENQESAHLGRRLAGPVSRRFSELTGGRYGMLELDPNLAAQGLEVRGGPCGIDSLSVGTRDQLATLFRLCIAEELKTVLVLDDHLAQSDAARVKWFRGMLQAAAQKIQIVVFTCRPEDYVERSELPGPDAPVVTLAGGLVRIVDLERVLRRHRPSLLPPLSDPEMRAS